MGDLFGFSWWHKMRHRSSMQYAFAFSNVKHFPMFQVLLEFFGGTQCATEARHLFLRMLSEFFGGTQSATEARLFFWDILFGDLFHSFANILVISDLHRLHQK